MKFDYWINAFRVCVRSVQSVIAMTLARMRLHHLLLVAVFVLTGVSFWFSYELRFDFNVPTLFQVRRAVLLPYVALLKVLAFYFIGGHSTNWRYFGIRDLPALFVHGTVCSAIVFLLSASFDEFWVPRGVIVIDFLLSTMLVGGLRIGLRVLRERLPKLFHKKIAVGRQPAIVIGAGDAGEMIIREMLRNRDNRFDVQALFDDDKAKQGLSIHGISVEGGVDDIPLYLQEKKVPTLPSLRFPPRPTHK